MSVCYWSLAVPSRHYHQCNLHGNQPVNRLVLIRNQHQPFASQPLSITPCVSVCCVWDCVSDSVPVIYVAMSSVLRYCVLCWSSADDTSSTPPPPTHPVWARLNGRRVVTSPGLIYNVSTCSRHNPITTTLTDVPLTQTDTCTETDISILGIQWAYPL